MRGSFLVVLCPAVMAAACGGGGGNATNGDAGGAGGSGGGTGGSGGIKADGGDAPSPECTPPDNTGPLLTGVFSADPAPTPMGGTITSGVYRLTDFTYHGGTFTCQVTEKETLDIVADSDTSGAVRQIELLNGFTYPIYYHYTTSGTTMTANQFCNVTNNTFPQTYTATPTQLLFFNDINTECAMSRLVLTFTKQ